MIRNALVAAICALAVSLFLWLWLPPRGQPSSLSIILAGLVAGLGIVATALWFRVRDTEGRLRRIEIVLAGIEHQRIREATP